MKKNEEEHTNIDEHDISAIPKRGWCVVASGLCIDKTRIVTEYGFAAKEDADEAACHTVTEAPTGIIGAKAVREPKHCKIVRMKEVEKGLLEPCETLLEKETFEDAKDVIKQHPDARMVYTSWTLGKKIAVGVGAALVVAGVVGGVTLGMTPQSASEPQAQSAGAPVSQTVRKDAEKKVQKSESAVSQPESNPTPTPDNGSSSASGSNSNASGGSTPAPTPDLTPAPHVHDWAEQTSQQWVPNEVWVEDEPAWDNPIYEVDERCICNSCGADVTDTVPAGVDVIESPHFAHTWQELADGKCSPGWHSQTNYVQVGTEHYDAEGHYEDHGHYETVVTGYVCSCGATK